MRGLARRLPGRPWLALLLVLALLLSGAAVVVQQHLADDLDADRVGGDSELRLLASLVQTSLQRGDYQALQTFFDDWGQSNHGVVALTAIAQNGFVIAGYRRPGRSANSRTFEATVAYSYRNSATLSLTRDLDGIYRDRNRFAVQLLTGFMITAALLTLLTRALLLRQREAARLRVRTAELDQANTALQQEVRQRRYAEEALHEAKERAEVTLHSIGDAVITTDAHGTVDYLNPIAEQLTGWAATEARGQPLDRIFHIVNEITREPVDNPVERVLRESHIVGLANHTVLVTRDGRERAIEDSAAPIRNRAGEIVGVVMVFHDVTESRELAQQLSWQATHDPLTGLLNRREFENRLGHALATARTDNQAHALLYMDLDQFKVVNDTCGHTAGDQLLRQLSHIKEGHLRAGDTLARLGGDEFGVLLENCPVERAVQIAESLRLATRQFRFVWENRSFEIGVSIGVVPIHAQSASLTTLLAAADMACYAAKEAGRNRVHLYRESDAELNQRHGEMLWVSRLNAALQEDRLVLYRQSIVPARGPDPGTHFELLLRLRSEDGALVPPGTFLPAAERYNLMPAIDRWVVNRVLARETRAPCCAPGEECLIAINLSGASLGDERFLESLHDELRRRPATAPHLCFEITETAAIANLARAAAFMRELRALGCRFALDDFGSGLSSFGYLKNLPVDFLKIDGSLIRGVVASRTDLAMVQAINAIGHTLGIRTIAEFVENDAIRDQLAEIGVDFVQGYGVARPQPFD